MARTARAPRIWSPPTTHCSATPRKPAPFGRPDRSRGTSERPQRPTVPQLPANRHQSAARTARAEHPNAPNDPLFRNPRKPAPVGRADRSRGTSERPRRPTVPQPPQTGTSRPSGPLARNIRTPPATQCSATPPKPAPVGRADRSRGGSGRAWRGWHRGLARPLATTDPLESVIQGRTTMNFSQPRIWSRLAISEFAPPFSAQTIGPLVAGTPGASGWVGSAAEGAGRPAR